MNHDELVAAGQPPWCPKPGSDSVDIWHKYDLPLIGTYRLQSGGLVLFTAIGEARDRLSVWAYVPVPGEEEADLQNRQFDSVDEMRTFVESKFAGREVIFALAVGLKIRNWSPMVVADDLLEVATAFLGQLLDADQREPTPSVLFQAKLAQVEVTQGDLVDA